MEDKMGNRKYDQKTMFPVSKSKNPNLFPELKIPRTTANYWIKNEIHLSRPIRHKDCRFSDIELLRNKIAQLQRENRDLKSIIKCLSAYIKIINVLECPTS